MSWWKPEVQYLVVEIEKGVSYASAGDEGAIASLKHHPGFVALMNRMKLKRAVLEAQLKGGRHKEIRDVDILQLGLYWLGYAEHEINSAVGNLKEKSEPRLAVNELEEFQRVRSAIESVGATNTK